MNHYRRNTHPSFTTSSRDMTHHPDTRHLSTAPRLTRYSVKLASFNTPIARHGLHNQLADEPTNMRRVLDDAVGGRRARAKTCVIGSRACPQPPPTPASLASPVALNLITVYPASADSLSTHPCNLLLTHRSRASAAATTRCTYRVLDSGPSSLRISQGLWRLGAGDSALHCASVFCHQRGGLLFGYHGRVPGVCGGRDASQPESRLLTKPGWAGSLATHRGVDEFLRRDCSKGVLALAYPASNLSDAVSPCTCSLLFKCDDTARTATLLLQAAILTTHGMQTFVIQYDANELVSGAVSLNNGKSHVTQPQLDELLRDNNNTRSDVKTLALTVKQPGPVWCPASLSFAPSPGSEASFRQFVDLTKATEINIVFDFKNLQPLLKSMLKSFGRAARDLAAFPVEGYLTRAGLTKASWEVFGPVDVAEAPPAYDHSRKRPWQETSTSPSPSPKRLARQSPPQSPQSDTTIPFSPAAAEAFRAPFEEKARFKKEVALEEQVAFEQQVALEEQLAFKEQLAIKEQVSFEEQVAFEQQALFEKQAAFAKRVALQKQALFEKQVAFQKQVAIEEQVAMEEQAAFEVQVAFEKQVLLEKQAAFENQAAVEKQAAFKKQAAFEKRVAFNSHAAAINAAVAKQLPGYLDQVRPNLLSQAIKAAVAEQLSSYLEQALPTVLANIVPTLFARPPTDLSNSSNSSKSSNSSNSSNSTHSSHTPSRTLPPLSALGQTYLPHLKAHLTDQVQQDQAKRTKEWEEVLHRLSENAARKLEEETAGMMDDMKEHKTDMRSTKDDAVRDMNAHLHDAIGDAQDKVSVLREDMDKDMQQGIDVLCDKIERLKQLLVKRVVAFEVRKYWRRRKRAHQSVGQGIVKRKSPKLRRIKHKMKVLGRRRYDEWEDV
ncbi:hypothetical protein P153DRAFT_391146 [Dothidotthia symphoricarpi CBS 119687]|uniref:Uncharacterized protein n=1 Tax=Dothidotthia symphoricarpi CBS 119687 TaxID=1392245 RepID=A0A6A5ZW25_9PLEO|nr:uncharacterized protein P153DRAFT_391146 [Dothidotthia symphoricarpi CBS 119687]KAF2123729.1 hypothetical protein P153DRAFT_391146 [Dothidotthia symphoricarpi CBS 119687]